jgi:hypothetical protein
MILHAEINGTGSFYLPPFVINPKGGGSHILGRLNPSKISFKY